MSRPLDPPYPSAFNISSPGYSITVLSLTKKSTSPVKELAHNKIKTYPNPVINSALSIQCDDPIISLTLYNAIGQKVLLIRNPDHLVTIPGNISNGMYVLECDTKTYRTLDKVIVNR